MMRIQRWMSATLAILATSAMVMVACSRSGDSPTAPISFEPATSSNQLTAVPAAPSQPTVTQSTGICAGKVTWQSSDGKLVACVINTNLILTGESGERCQRVPDTGITWTYTIGIVSDSAGYIRASEFGDPVAGCGATAQEVGTSPFDRKTFPAGDSTFTFTWTDSGSDCGRKQRDMRLVNTTSSLEVGGFVFNFPRSCLSCELIAGALENLHQSGSTVTVMPRFNARVGGLTVRAKVDWGDGNITDPVVSGVALNHSYPANPRKTYHIKLLLKAGDVECGPSLDVTVGEDPGCESYPVPPVSVSLGEPSTSQTATTFTVHSIPVTKNPAGVDGGFTPTLPKLTGRQPIGQSTTLNFLYNWMYKYQPTPGLDCLVEGKQPKDVSVPPISE